MALPEDPYNEHQIETLLRLLQPLGVAVANQYTVNLDLTLPEPAEQFAATLLAPLGHARFMLVNLSSTASLRFRDEDFAELIYTDPGHNRSDAGHRGRPGRSSEGRRSREQDGFRTGDGHGDTGPA